MNILMNLLKSKVSKNVWENISLLQEKAKKYMGTEDCMICMDENNEKFPIKCRHPICQVCYDELILRGWNCCPYCKHELEPVEVYARWAIIIAISENCFGVIFQPIIYDDIKKEWTEVQICCQQNDKGITNLIKLLKKYNYTIYNSTKFFDDIFNHKNFSPIQLFDGKKLEEKVRINLPVIHKETVRANSSATHQETIRTNATSINEGLF
jgi:hypothetical protein